MTAGDPKSGSVVCLGQMSHEAVSDRGAYQTDLSSSEHASHGSSPTPSGLCKYSLRARSVRKRLETESRQLEPALRQPRTKSRPQQLSKYRRKTANTRERDRMRDINRAFDTLERAVPQLAAAPAKVTKITILRLAINYIKAMRTALDSDDEAAARQDGVSQGSSASVASVSSGSSEVFSPSPSTSSLLTDASSELPDPLDTIEELTDFQLPGGLDLLLDISNDSDELGFSCSDFSDLPSP